MASEYSYVYLADTIDNHRHTYQVDTLEEAEKNRQSDFGTGYFKWIGDIHEIVHQELKTDDALSA